MDLLNRRLQGKICSIWSYFNFPHYVPSAVKNSSETILFLRIIFPSFFNYRNVAIRWRKTITENKSLFLCYTKRKLRLNFIEIVWGHGVSVFSTIIGHVLMSDSQWIILGWNCSKNGVLGLILSSSSSLSN